MGKDSNDIFQQGGPEALRRAIDEPEFNPEETLDPNRDLTIGSEAEVAQRVVEDLRTRFGEVVYSEGEFWIWKLRHWDKLTEASLMPFIRKYDGAKCQSDASGMVRDLRLSDRMRKGIQRFVALDLQQDDFFAESAVGINVRNGFISFMDGQPTLIPHSPDHRQRHVLETEWSGELVDEAPEGTFLHKLIDGCFKGDPDAREKAFALAEACACAMLGLGTKLANPKAFVLYGASANNGKSRFLALFQAVLSNTAVSNLTAQQLGDERMRATLPGVLLNTSDELGSAAIRSDMFKSAVTGEKTAARQVYQVPVSFSPQAQHIFATNTLPPFSDGMDAGVLRRLFVISFNRTIPEAERIANIDKLIVRHEAALFLSWIIAGAVRLLEQGKFTEVPSSADVIQEWTSVSDPIIAWLDDHDFVEVTGSSTDRVHVRNAHSAFKKWGEEVGLPPSAIPWQKPFTQRLNKLNRSDVGVKHTREGNVIVGIRLRHPSPKCDG